MKKILSTIFLFCLLATTAISQTCDLFGTTPDDSTSPDIWVRPFSDGTCCSGLGPVSYQVYGPFQVSTTGNYNIESIQTGWDGYLFIYENAFDPTNQSTNYVAGDDDGNGGIGTSNIDAVPLTAGTNYYIVTTGFAAGDFGAYTTAITGAGTATCIPPAPIPTMGEWGLILLSLLTLTLGVVTVMRRQMALAGSGNASVSMSTMPFDGRLFAKILPMVLSGFAGIFAVAVFAFGYEMTSADVPGALLTTPVVAYLVHLFVGKSKRA